MTNVLAFRARPAAPPPVPPAELPPAAEIAAALQAIDHAVLALGTIDLDGIAHRTLTALATLPDAEPDNAADAVMHQRAAEAHAMVAAGTFKRIATTVADMRAHLQQEAGQ
jgi:hypothetical protein